VLTKNHQQEALSRAYIQAVAGRCGLGCIYRDFDYGIDMTLHEIRRRGRRYIESGFKLDIQAKSVAGAPLTDTHVLYDMRVAAYDDLRDPDVGCPRILVVLALPADEAAWTDQSEEAFSLRGCAYWLALRGMGPTANRHTVRVPVPRANVFSVGALAGLMARVRQGEPL
jgi:hypothetical protein